MKEDIQERMMKIISSLYQRLETKSPKTKRPEVRSEAQETLATLREEIRSQEDPADQRLLERASLLSFQGLA